MLLPMLLLVSASPVSHTVLDEIPLQSPGHCRVVLHDINEFSSEIRTECHSPSGEILWSVQSPPVRSDAAAGFLCEGATGEILSVSTFGEGYTDILILLIDQAGTVIGRDTLAMECYDSPQALASTASGFILLWDSWSQQRGTHMAFVNREGIVSGTCFVSYTINPGPVAMDTGEAVLVGISPLLAEGDVLFCYSPDGELHWSVTPELPETAQLIEEIELLESGLFTVRWHSLPDSEGGTVSTITRHDCKGGIISAE